MPIQRRKTQLPLIQHTLISTLEKSHDLFLNSELPINIERDRIEQSICLSQQRKLLTHRRPRVQLQAKANPPPKPGFERPTLRKLFKSNLEFLRMNGM
jgi:hypothetical protein